MIDYKYADLYYEDSVFKQINIETEDGSVITNEDVYSEEMSLSESLCSESSLTFGCCEASCLKLKIANRFSPLYGQWLTVTETLNDNTDEAFLFGRYKVQSDKPAADRSYRDITAYDAMYDIINADGVDVADWYNEILPDYDSTVTLKKFRQSFLQHLGIEEIDASLVNDDMVIEKTIETSSLSGQRVIKAICEINGVFAHITRDGKLEYIQLEPINTDKAFDIPINKSSDYEDFETKVINCLQIREDDSDPGVVYGSGANRYIISGNFLLYGKTTEDLITVTANLYPVINNITYRPATLTVPGNPCIEVGDVVHLSTKYQEIYTYVLKRDLSGIQALTDVLTSDGTETYVDDGGSLSEKIEQIKSRTSELASEVKENTESISIAVEMIEADYANFLVLEAEVANIQTLFAEYATIQELEAALARIDELYVDYEEVNNLVVQNLEAVYADIGSLYADLANINALFANYATIENLTALEAYIANEYVSNAVIADLLVGYAKITDLDAVYADISELDADMATIAVLLGGVSSIGELTSIHLTTDNAIIDEAVIAEALIGTVLADIINSNIIYTDYITIMSENGGIVIAGTTMQFSDSSGTVRLQLGEDADGNFTFVLYDETGEGIMIDSEGIHASAVPDGLIVNDMVADDAAIAGTKLDIQSVSECLNAAGLLEIDAAKVTINGETLDYQLTQITQQIEDIETMGIDSIVNYYAIGSEEWYPPIEGWEKEESAILGEAVLGTMVLSSNGGEAWTIDQPKTGENEWLWWSMKITYVDGTIVWTTPALWTDNYLRTILNVQQTELEVIQGQIQAKVWMSDIKESEDELTTMITDQYGELTVLIDTIDQRVGTLTTTFDEEFQTLYSQVTSLTLNLDGITGRVEEVSEKTANAIVEGVPYYTASDSPNWYTPHEVGDEAAILGEMVLGAAELGADPNGWSTEQPEYTEGMYTWISYLRTRVDGSTYWTEPTLLTDEWLRLNMSEMSEKYSQLVLTIDSALLEVYSAISTVEGNVTELSASIYEYVDEKSADILSEVAGLYVTDTEFTSVTASIEQYIDAQTASIRSDLEYYATTDDVTDQIREVTNTINQTITNTAEGLENSILIEVSNTLIDYSKIDETVTDVVPYYVLSDSSEICGHDYEINEDFSDQKIPDGWSIVNGNYGTYELVVLSEPDSAGISSYLMITRTDSSYNIQVRGDTLPTCGKVSIYIYARIGDDVDLSQFNSDDVLFRFGIIIGSISYVASVYLNDRSKNTWYNIKTTIDLTNYRSDDATYRFIFYPGTVGLSVMFTNIHLEYSDWQTEIPNIESDEEDKYLWSRNLITYVDGHTEWTEPVCYLTWVNMNASIEAYVDDSIASITLSVEGGLGSSASIIMTAGDISTSANLDLTEVRQAFADDESSVEIKAGTIAFSSNTLLISSTNCILEADGSLSVFNGVFSGTVSTISNDHSTILDGGGLAFYYNDLEYADIYATVWASNSQERGLHIGVTKNSSYFSISHYNESSGNYIADYIINYDMEEYSYKHNFSGDVGFINNVYFNSFAYFNYSVNFYSHVNILTDIICYSDSVVNFRSGSHISMVGDCEIGWYLDQTYSTLQNRIYGNSSGLYLYGYNNTIYMNGTKYSSSDKKLKIGIKTMSADSSEQLVEEIDNLDPVEFEWADNQSDTGKHYGYVANDVQKVMPELVKAGDDDTLYLAYEEIIPLLHIKIKQLESRIKQLEGGSEG